MSSDPLSLTTAKVAALVAEVADMSAKGDNEGAHLAQDALMVKTLESVAGGHPGSQELATEALKVFDVDFDRWYS